MNFGVAGENNFWQVYKQDRNGENHQETCISEKLSFFNQIFILMNGD